MIASSDLTLKAEYAGGVPNTVKVLYLSGLNMMERILTKNNWLRFPPKPEEAKLLIMGGDLL